jgi:hypothetical protein
MASSNIGPGGQVLGLGVLDLVVADAVLAGHEDHAGGGDGADVDRVVPGATDHVHVRQAQGLGRMAHAGHAVGVELRRLELAHLLEGHLALAVPANAAKPSRIAASMRSRPSCDRWRKSTESAPRPG